MFWTSLERLYRCDAERQFTPTVAGFERFLLRDRGLASSTTGGYRASVRKFLLERFGGASVDLGALHAIDIIDFMQRQPRHTKPHRLKHVAAALRAFLRWGQYLGEIDTAL